MKYLLHRLTALWMAVLLVLGCASPALSAPAGGTDPYCALGTFSGDMLTGGAQVQTEDGLFYVGAEDGYIYNLLAGPEPVYAQRAARLNYRDGVLWFARLNEDGFDLCSYEIATKTETVLLAGLRGKPGQVWLVGEDTLYFLWDNAIWMLEAGDEDPRLLLFDAALWSFVPTAVGPVWATGSLFDLTLWAGDYPVADHVRSWYVMMEPESCVLCLSVDGEDLRLDLAAAMQGVRRTVELPAEEPEVVTVEARGGVLELLTDCLGYAREVLGCEAMEQRLAELQSRLPLGSDDEKQPVETEPVETEPVETEPVVTEPVETEPVETEPVETEPVETEPVETEPAETEPVETEPVETEPVETEPVETEPEETEPVETEPATVPERDKHAMTNLPYEIFDPAAEDVPPTDPDEPPLEADENGVYRRPMDEGTANILRRAQQMLRIQWRARRDVVGWNGNYTYKAGTVYTGLPYSQPVDTQGYVPWNISLSEFVARVGYYYGAFYTQHSTFNDGLAPYYGTDCSGFASWAWDLPHRCTTGSINSFAVLVSADSYADIQVGDILNNVRSHVVLVTDVTYDAEGTITSVEISQASPTVSAMGVCRSTRYEGDALAAFRSSYFGSGFKLYRCATRSETTYTHECVVRLEGDECPLCGEGKFLKHGVDVSQWQSEIDWAAAQPHIDFAILRVSYGTRKLDTRIYENLEACEKLGIPYGLYIYSLAGTPEEAAAEAEYLLAAIEGYHPDLPIFFDVEEPDINLCLPNDELLAVVTAFCDAVEKAGFQAGVYSSTNYWNRKLSLPEYNRWVRWVAQYAQELDANEGANLWQFTDNGTVPGIEGNVDMNYWFGPVGSWEHRYHTEEIPATCLEPGLLSYVCVDCGHSVSRELAPLGHTFENGACVRCGEPEDPMEKFGDLDLHAWYAEAVRWVVEHGLFKGTSETTFSPGQTMSRAMLVTVLWRLAGSPLAADPCGFTDVPETAWYAEAVAWAVENDIVKGTSETTFSPMLDVTREQTATLLRRWAAWYGADTAAAADLTAFPDAERVSEYAVDALAWAVAYELIRGVRSGDEDLLSPQGGATRAQVATILQRFSALISPEEEVDGEDPE